MKLLPAQLQEELNKISDTSYGLHQELAGIAERSGEAKLELMRDSKSAKEAEMRWNATEDGKREAYLKAFLKGLSHKRTALIQEIKSNSSNPW